MPIKKCPFCGEEIQSDAVKCRYCREWLIDDNARQQPEITVEEIENKDNFSAKPNQSLSQEVSAVVVPQEEKKPLPKLKRQSFRSGIILQSIIIVLWFFASPYMLDMDVMSHYLGFFLYFPLLFFCSIGGFWTLYTYLQNFESQKPILKLMKTFTIGSVIAFFLIMFLQMLSLSGLGFELEEDTQLSLLSGSHPADISFRVFLLLLLSYAYIVIGCWLVRSVKDFVGGLKPLGYMMCVAASVFLLYVLVGVAGYDALWIITVFFYLMAIGVSILIINVFNKASGYVHFTGYAPYTSSSEQKKSESSFNQVHVVVAIFVAALLSGITYFTNNGDGFSGKWFTQEDNVEEEISAPVIKSENDTINESVKHLESPHGISYYYNINYPEAALLNTSGVDSLVWKTYNLNNGTKTFQTKCFIHFDREGTINTYKEFDENNKVLYTIYYTIADDLLTRCTYFDYTEKTYFADELDSIRGNEEIWHRKYTLENDESTDRVEGFQLGYTEEGNKMSVGYYSYDQEDRIYIKKVFDKERKLLSTDYYTNDEKTGAEVNEYNNFGRLTGRRITKKNSPEDVTRFSYVNDSRGNWIEQKIVDTKNSNTTVIERTIYYRK